MFENFFKTSGPYFYFVFRIMIGFMFFCHGGQKLFGWFGGQAQPLLGLMGLAGVLEFAGGLLVALGLFTRLASGISALVMLAAYFMAHASNGLLPIVNKGELALVYFAAFLVLFAYGGRKWQLDKVLFKKEVF